MLLHRGLRAPLALVALLLAGLADGPPTFTIGLGQSASGVLTARAPTHVYLLDVPAGTAGFTVEVRGRDRDAELAVYCGDVELHADPRSDPRPMRSVADPPGGTYRIVVSNPFAEDLDYVLTVVTDGAEAVAAPDAGPIGHGACETDGTCRAP